MPKARFFLWLTVVLVIAAFFRFHQLGSIPVSLYWDEVAMLADAKAVATTGQDMHGNHWFQAMFLSYGDFKLPVYIWLASLSVKWFGVSEWALRLPSTLAGIGTVLLVSSLTWQLWLEKQRKSRQQLAFLTGLVAAIAPWGILFSRTGFEGHVAQFLLAGSIWSVIKARGNRWWLLLAVLLGSLATYAYFSVRFVWLIVFAAATILWLVNFKKQLWKQLLGFLVLPIAVYLLTLLPLYQSPSYAPSQQFRFSTKSVMNTQDWPVEANQHRLQAGNTFIDKAIYHPLVLQAQALAENYADNLSADFLFFTGDQNLRHGTGQHGLFYAWLIVPFLYGWYQLFPKYWRQGALLAIWWLAALLPASVPMETPHALRSLNAFVPLTIVIGWGLWNLWEAIDQAAWNKRLKQLILFGALGLLALSVMDFWSYYSRLYPARSAADWQDGYKTLAAEIWQLNQTADQAFVEPFDDRFWLWVVAYEMPPEQLEPMSFQQPVWEVIDGRSESIGIVGEKPAIDEQLKTIETQPSWYKTMYTADGAPAFAAVFFNSP